MDIAQPAELLELSGKPLDHSVLFEFESLRGRTSDVLNSANGASIADIVRGKIWVRVNCTSGEELSDYFDFGNGPYRFASTAFKELIEKWSIPKIEFYPVSIILRAHGTTHPDAPWKDGDDLIDGYWLLNCWNRIDAIDAEKSEAFDAIPKPGIPTRIVRWKRLVFKAPLTENLFGFEHHLLHRLYVSPAFRHAVEQAGLNVWVFPKLTILPNRNVRGEVIP